MTVANKALVDALYRTFLEALPWYMKITKGQRFRWEGYAHQGAVLVEQMRTEVETDQ